MTKVSEWMTQNPITIDANCSIIEAIHQMKEKQIRRLPVMQNGKFAGIVTDRMIMAYTPSKATSLDTWEVHYLLAKTPVSEAMNPNPFTVTPDTPLIEAARIIHDNKLYGLCVVDIDGNLVGILTTTNILEALIALCPQD
ncbi:MAG TPA: CBS domain-containing protein [Geobacteraceae bacterium]|nr:CBS domain-containing protein [Geobacteraceae bacterium]